MPSPFFPGARGVNEFYFDIISTLSKFFPGARGVNEFSLKFRQGFVRFPIFLFLVFSVANCCKFEPSFGSRPMRSLPFGEKMPQMPQKRKRRAFRRQSSSVPSVFS